jgi:hypothetical protein
MADYAGNGASDLQQDQLMQQIVRGSGGGRLPPVFAGSPEIACTGSSMRTTTC